MRLVCSLRAASASHRELTEVSCCCVLIVAMSQFFFAHFICRLKEKMIRIRNRHAKVLRPFFYLKLVFEIARIYLFVLLFFFSSSIANH